MSEFQLKQSNLQLQADLDLTENLQPAFSFSSTYTVGEVVVYDGKLWKCHTRISTPGGWTGTYNWTQINISDISGTLIRPNPTGTSVNGLSRLQIGSDIFDIITANPSGTPTSILTKVQIGKNSYKVGTPISANPGGATGQLTTILIGDTIYSIGTSVEGNPNLTGTTTLNKIKIGSTVYNVPQGTTVQANPSGTAADVLNKIQIGSSIFEIPSGTNVIGNPGGGSINLHSVTIGQTKYKVSTIVPTLEESDRLLRAKIDNKDYRLGHLVIPNATNSQYSILSSVDIDDASYKITSVPSFGNITTFVSLISMLYGDNDIGYGNYYYLLYQLDLDDRIRRMANYVRNTNGGDVFYFEFFEDHNDFDQYEHSHFGYAEATYTGSSDPGSGSGSGSGSGDNWTIDYHQSTSILDDELLTKPIKFMIEVRNSSYTPLRVMPISASDFNTNALYQ